MPRRFGESVANFLFGKRTFTLFQHLKRDIVFEESDMKGSEGIDLLYLDIEKLIIRDSLL